MDTEVAFSGANVNSNGLGPALMNEMKQAYQLVTTGADMSAGRGSGLEVGLATVVPNGTNANQINPGSTIQAFAPESTGLLEKHFIDVDLEPIINSDYLRGEAQAMYGPCVLGQPISFGRGYAGSADVVNSSTDALLATNTTPGNDAVSQSRSFTYLVPNGSGKYALVSETRQILAPITLLPTIDAVAGVVIEFAGEWVLRSTATGLQGGSTVVYGPEASSPDVKVLTIKVAGLTVQEYTTKQFLDRDGLAITVPGVGQVVIGESPRAIGGAYGSDPVMAANGTRAAAATDVLRVTTSELAATLGIDLADIRVGHMESEAIVPQGGIECGIPVKKTGTPAEVIAGGNQVVNYTITVPSDKDAMNAVACDLMNIKVVDVTTAEDGVLFEIVSASEGGKIVGNTVTWENIGTYKPGDAPMVLNVGLKVPAGSAAGKITDTATATAILGNCKGNASANKDISQRPGQSQLRRPERQRRRLQRYHHRRRCGCGSARHAGAHPCRRCPDRRRRHQSHQQPDAADRDRPGLHSPDGLPDRPASPPERLNQVDHGRVAGLKNHFRATARRRLALVLLLVVGGGMLTFILLPRGESPGPVASETPPAGQVTAVVPDTIPDLLPSPLKSWPRPHRGSNTPR